MVAAGNLHLCNRGMSAPSTPLSASPLPCMAWELVEGEISGSGPAWIPHLVNPGQDVAFFHHGLEFWGEHRLDVLCVPGHLGAVCRVGGRADVDERRLGDEVHAIAGGSCAGSRDCETSNGGNEGVSWPGLLKHDTVGRFTPYRDIGIVHTFVIGDW